MVLDVSEINAALNQNAAEYIEKCDAAFADRIREIAEFIVKNRKQRPVVLLSGPSGSGKTTTARILERMLDEQGCGTHTVSMDNYFLPIPVGFAVDLESPDRVDGALLSQQLADICQNKPVILPRFNFNDNTRSFAQIQLHRAPDEIVIVEGIHALNPSVITLPEESTTRIYVSVRTRMSAQGALLHPKKIRLLRRMERDKLFRGRTVADTLKMFESVQRGENQFIMPYKSRSMFDVDTFVPYGVSAYREQLLPQLETLRGGQIDDLIRVVRAVQPLKSTLIPPDALIREFIGGSCYE